MTTNETSDKQLNFLEEIIERDLSEGKHKSILTRFPRRWAKAISTRSFRPSIVRLSTI